MAQFPQFNDSQNALLAKIAANTGESQPKVGDGQHNLLFKIAQNTYASSGLLSTAIQESGNNYVLVQPGDNLAAKYAEAKAKSPSASNRITVFIIPGTYSLSSELSIDAEFVDLVGLGAQFQSPAVIVSNNTLNVKANNVRISGISVGTQAFKCESNKPLHVFENCVGGNSSFSQSTASGTYINCVAGNLSFGYATASGVFINCNGGSSCFGVFGSSGQFTNCRGGNSSFGNTTSGRILFCKLTQAGDSYPTPSGSGIIRFCLDGDDNIVNADAP
jgi:hypothetical protein